MPADHPLRQSQPLADQALQRLSPKLEAMYAELGRPSIPPERLLKAKLLHAFFTIRSETLRVEALHDNLLFRWFLDLNLTDAVWDHSRFTTNQERLLAHRAAQEFFGESADLARERGWLSAAHFTADGTLIQAWASLKSFAPKGGTVQKTDADPGKPSVNFKGQPRSNATPQSTPDPEARLAKQAAGQEAKLCYGLHVLMENRHGLCAGLAVTPATGTAETAAAQTLLRRQKKEQKQTPQSVGADKNYPNAEFVTFCRQQQSAPHIATRAERKVKGLDGRTTRTKNYQRSQALRKRGEEGIGWIKEIGGLRRVKGRAAERVGWHAWRVGGAYNLVRRGKLMEASPPAMVAAGTGRGR